ncbi:sugar ABC transporter permease [Wukongibacter baidiensis]|uniref:carbohydrate ABC transporter permease n=1 Tax=Wukongibacter baidiensis TaxID=1723361 RepID=UPI003D7FBC33
MTNDFQRTKKKGVSIERKIEKWAYLFIIGPLLYFFTFRMFPTLFSFYLSVTKWDLLSSNKPFSGLENFKDVVNDPVFRTAIVNTLKYLVVAVPICLVLSLGIALVLNAIVKGKGLFRMLIFIPYITSTVAISWVWKWMFMKNGGVINTILIALGLKAQPFLNSTTQAIYVIISNIVWKQIGFNTIIFIAGLMQISRTYYEAAEIDGASSWQQFKNITLPLLNPTVVYLAVINTISTLQVFTQIFNIAGPEGGPLNSTNSIVVEIYKTAFMSYKMGRASAMTVILFIIILGITLFQMKVLNKEN